MSKQRTFILNIASIAVALFFTLVSFVPAQDLILKMDQECENFTRFQTIGYPTLWKVSQKRDVGLSMLIREVGKSNVIWESGFKFSLRHPIYIFAITCYEEAEEQKLKFTFHYKNGGIAREILASVGFHVKIGLSAPKLIEISNDSSGQIILNNTYGSAIMKLTSNNYPANISLNSVPPIKDGGKKYELVLKKDEHGFISGKSGDSEIRSKP
jgi:hypothetical protein